MPRVVDADDRRRVLGDAVWRVIRRDGVERASVRAVAQDAGLSAGSLRHYFGTQSELLAFAMRSVVERVQARVGAMPRPDDPGEAAQALLEQALPLDDERRAEVEVWLAFTGQALVDPVLRDLRDHGERLLYEGCRRLLVAMAGPDVPDEVLDLEAHRLHAVLDGLSIHALARPAQVTGSVMRAVLRRHLAALPAALDGAGDHT